MYEGFILFTNQTVSSDFFCVPSKRSDQNQPSLIPVLATTETVGDVKRVCFMGLSSHPDAEKICANISQIATAYYRQTAKAEIATKNNLIEAASSILKGNHPIHKKLSLIAGEAFSSATPAHQRIEFYAYIPATDGRPNESFSRLNLEYRNGAFVETSNVWQQLGNVPIKVIEGKQHISSPPDYEKQLTALPALERWR